MLRKMYQNSKANILHRRTELRRLEYIRLLQASENNPRLYMIMSTICGTGIGISELKHSTVEAVSCKK